MTAFDPRKPTKTVYSLIYPETRRVIAGLWAEHPHHLYAEPWTKRQDEMHLPFVEAYRRQCLADLGPEEFPHVYATAGASEGIKDVISLIAASGDKAIDVWDGEYEGYGEYARGLGLYVTSRVRRQDPSPDAPERTHFFVSQPSARDGNWWPEFSAFLAHTDRTGAYVHLDLTYYGATGRGPSPDDLPPKLPPCVKSVFVSLSKVYGVYYHRVGLCFRRDPVPNLYGNVWFKNLFSVELGTRLLEGHPLGTLPRKYAPYQKQVCEGLGLVPSDSVMLATGGDRDDLTRFVDQPGSKKVRRACLTPILQPLIDRESGPKRD